MDTFLVSHSVVSSVLLNDLGEFMTAHDSLEDLLNSVGQDALIICDSKQVSDACVTRSMKYKIDFDNPSLQSWRLDREKKLEEYGLTLNQEEYYNRIRIEAVDSSREGVKANSAKADEIVAQVIQSIDDLQKAINLTSNRISEVYALHFPELVDGINNIVTLARIIRDEPRRTELKVEHLTNYGIPRAKVEKILSYQHDSLGGEMSLKELQPVQNYATALISMYEESKNLEKWIDDSMDSIAPNLTAVAGANVGARLISAMGSLHALAMKSSSKIQIIGAERALYSAMRSRGTSPKHGIIFQIPEIGNSSYWIRGKISRAFAAKIVIAARIDLFNGEFIGEKLRQDLRDYTEQLRKQYPNPPLKKEKKSNYKTSKPKRKQKKGRRRQ
ncbi:MAG: hypothetical protein INQ03_04625 [Candidatus Heimdallarchaeota archaeon]|nr:hypothetical protein [Candidatus Heimdallarchaeota archaeon]